MAQFTCTAGDATRRTAGLSWKASLSLIAAILLLGLGSAAAQEMDDSLYLPALGARALGMGGTGVASTSTLSATLLNPASLAYFSFWETSIDYRRLSRLVRGGSLQGVIPCKPYSTIIGFSVDGIQANRRQRPGTLTVERNWLVQYSAIGARMIKPGLSVGATIKYYRSQLFGSKDGAFNSDVGMVYQLPSQVFRFESKIGVVLRDWIPTSVERRGHDTTFDFSALAGISGRRFFRDSSLQLGVALDIEAPKREFVDNSFGVVRMGVEIIRLLSSDIQVAARSGTDFHQWTLGAGIRWRYVQLDWAKVLPFDGSDFSNAHTFSLMANCRQVYEAIFEGRGALMNWRDSLPIYRGEEFDHYGSVAKDQFDAGQNDTAYVLFHNARVFADSSQQVARADSGIVRSRLALDRLRAKADSVLRVTLLDSLLHKDREFTDSMYLLLLSQADTCFRRRDYQCALDFLDMILSENPANTDALNLKGDVQKGRDGEIISSLGAADSAEREKLLGKALEAYLRILQLDSTHTDGDVGKGRIDNKLEAQRYAGRALQLYDQGYPAAARTAFDSAVGKDASLQSVRNYLVAAHSVRADTTSLDDIEKDSTVYPYYLSGMEFNREREYQRAIDAFNEVLKYYPNSPAVLKEINEARQMLIRSRQDSTQ